MTLFYPEYFGVSSILLPILLVAGLKNPTVRKRYLAVRELLSEYGHGDFYTSLLTLLGCASLSRETVAYHLSTLAAAFDAAAEVIQSPFPFRADIHPLSRPVAIDGSQELIAQGNHREAIFWMVATYSRCMQVFAADGSPEQEAIYSPGYRELLADLGITESTTPRLRREEVDAFLPRAWKVAEAIAVANPEIKD